MRAHRSTDMSDDGDGEVQDEDEDEDEDEDDDDDDDDDDDENEDEDDENEVEEENRPQDREAHFVRACAGETHMDMSRKPCCEILQEKCRTPIPRTAFCAHMDISQKSFCVL